MTRAGAVSFAVLAAACGGRTTGAVDGGGGDASLPLDANADAPQPDASCGDYASDPSPDASTAWGACGEGVNLTAAPANDPCSTNVGAAFEYVPQQDFVVERIELHTDTGTVGLLDSDPDCGGPGPVLFLAPLDSSGSTADWRGAAVQPPIALHANHKYFVWASGPATQATTICSSAVDGVPVRTYSATSPQGPWDGSFSSGVAWTARLDGLCP